MTQKAELYKTDCCRCILDRSLMVHSVTATTTTDWQSNTRHREEYTAWGESYDAFNEDVQENNIG